MDIKAILFDFGGTLFDYHPSNAEVWVNISKRLGFVISPNDANLLKGLEKQLNYNEKSAIQQSNEFDSVNWDDPFDEKIVKWNSFVLSSLNLIDLNPHKVVYEEFKKREGTYKIIKETKTLIEELHKRDIKLGMVSNTSKTSAMVRRPILQHHGILNFFKTLIFSSEVQCSKPDPKIFLLAIEDLQIPIENVMHVRDSFHADVKGAEKVGILPVLFDPLKFFTYDGYKIKNLLELLAIVDHKS